MKASDETRPQRSDSNVHREEVITVVSGQADLSMGYWLKRLRRSFAKCYGCFRRAESPVAFPS